MIDDIFPDCITLFEELLHDASDSQSLHLMLWSLGGDGETAIRLVRSAQARCRELTVIVPDMAKSAATLLVMGAHHILMGPTSDLGPVDPQLRFRTGKGQIRTAAAKEINAAVESALKAVQANPQSYPINAILLENLDWIIYQEAKSALKRTDELVKEALRSNPDRPPGEVNALARKLKRPLVDRSSSHAAAFGAVDAQRSGLPVVVADPKSLQWQLVWRLWAKYFEYVSRARVYEGARASQVLEQG